MTNAIIWLHEDALRKTHPVFAAAAPQTKAIFIWNDAYFKQSGYSLKRLVFIYEALCSLEIDVLQGDSLALLKQISPSAIYVPETINPFVNSTILKLPKSIIIESVADEPFVVVSKPISLRRFFQYWNKAQKTAFLVDGGVNAKRS